MSKVDRPVIEAIPERGLFAADREQISDFLIRITPPTPREQVTRPRLNMSIVLDRSGSMLGHKIAHARDAACYCVDQLLAQDRLGVVIFDDLVEVLVPSQQVENREQLKQRISGIQARNSTALHQAWVTGGIEVSQHLVEGGINRVLLITDGLANVGVTSVDTIVTQAAELAVRGVSTSTIGIGSDFNEDLLIPMAEAGRGNAWHVEQPSDMESIFATELKGLVAQVGHTVSLGFSPAEEVKIIDVMNDFPATHTGRYKLPNLQAGTPIDVVVRLRIPKRGAGERLKVLDLRLAYNPQGAPSSERIVMGQRVEVEFARAEEVENEPIDGRLTKAVQFLMAARARREAIELMDRGDFAGAGAKVRSTAQLMATACAPYMSDQDLIQEVQMLYDLDGELASPDDIKMTRKKMSYQSYNLARQNKHLK